jgi:predicted enzyme related to lactoylglutathione lyase
MLPGTAQSPDLSRRGSQGYALSEEAPVQNGDKFSTRLVGIELYFDDLQQGKQFYGDVFGLKLLDEVAGHHARFEAGGSFVCLERKGSESYTSRDKAVVFLEVSNLSEAIRHIGEEKIVATKPLGEEGRRPWAAFHDPEGYNIVVVEAPPGSSDARTAN